ncbi:hypothetical protein D9619_001236 [Psilocybe cf. subviscida]|uniref:Uncharacterized protein n=1 Tax=Psilocybe cf. subviscida TaxID=2480587 RepID=A0A8H5BEL4_9AGAR|nr:hypothetical protein D9619_001236 [Psilocybe cf. subviscida]
MPNNNRHGNRPLPVINHPLLTRVDEHTFSLINNPVTKTTIMVPAPVIFNFCLHDGKIRECNNPTERVQLAREAPDGYNSFAELYNPVNPGEGRFAHWDATAQQVNLSGQGVRFRDFKFPNYLLASHQYQRKQERARTEREQPRNTLFGAGLRITRQDESALYRQLTNAIMVEHVHGRIESALSRVGTRAHPYNNSTRGNNRGAGSSNFGNGNVADWVSQSSGPFYGMDAPLLDWNSNAGDFQIAPAFNFDASGDTNMVDAGAANRANTNTPISNTAAAAAADNSNVASTSNAAGSSSGVAAPSATTTTATTSGTSSAVDTSSIPALAQAATTQLATEAEKSAATTIGSVPKGAGRIQRKKPGSAAAAAAAAAKNSGSA